MDAILRLAKKYSKRKRTNILPCCDVNILENLHFLYDEDWENQSTRTTLGSDPIKKKINISKEIINKTRGAEASYAARMNHTPLRGEQQATVYNRLRCE